MGATRVLIVDSGMRNLGGHNFSYTRAVEEALARRGAAVTVFANKNLPAELAAATRYHPVFTCGAYDFAPGLGFFRDLAYIRAQAVLYADELELALRRFAGEPFDLVFCHTVGDFELLGWRRLLGRVRLPGHLGILLRNTGGFRRCGWLKRTAHPYWRLRPRNLAAIHARQRGRFTLLTDSEPLTEDFAHAYRHRVVTLPIPINRHLLADPPAAPAAVEKRFGLAALDGVRIGYMGDARPQKGFGLLPGLVRAVLAAGGARFVIQCPPAASGSAAEPPPGVRELQDLATEHGPRVGLVAEKLSERDYADLFHYLDVVLVPYTAANYAEATSGIFAEALALGKPVVVPAGTWMSRELEQHGAGVVFERGSSADLAAKTLDLVAHFGDHAARAERSRADWTAFHNAGTLADILLRECGAPPTPAAPSELEHASR